MGSFENLMSKPILLGQMEPLFMFLLVCSTLVITILSDEQSLTTKLPNLLSVQPHHNTT